jgi:carnitine O-palmitoyltransferase 2
MYAAEAYPLDMSQYGRLFASTRLPFRERDVLVTAAKAPTHIVVARGGALYRVEVLTPRGDRARPVAEVEGALAHILADGSAGAEPPVAALTGAGRDAWADARAALLAAPGAGGALNAASLAAVDDALFVLTLDGDAPATPEALSRTMLHGCGSNRWFDKCLNIVVAANGRAGVSWEHAWGDGVAVLNFFNAVFGTVAAAPARERPAPPLPAAAAKLGWALDAAALAAVRAAAAGTAAAIAATALKVYQTDSLNKADIKRSGLSPDGVMQAALQLAHWRAHGGPLLPATYESASTAGFRHGRTETVRSATPEAAALCAAFDAGAGAGGAATPEARFAALRAATEQHRALTLDGVKGQGCDRHLFALGLLAAADGGAAAPAAAAFFADPAYAHFKDIRLSTSTMSSPALDGGGFGPVSPHSYAVGYGTEERGCHFHIMAAVGPGAAANGPHAAAVAAPFRGALDNAALAEGVEGALRDIRACIVAVKGDTVKGGSGGGFKQG